MIADAQSGLRLCYSEAAKSGSKSGFLMTRSMLGGLHNFHWHYLRNEFNFWNVHGIMNTLGLLQSK